MGKTITEEAFEDGFNLIGEVAQDQEIGVPLPSGTAKKDFLQWVKGLPEREPPTYLGLPPNAEKLLLVADAEGMLKNLKSLSNVQLNGYIHYTQRLIEFSSMVFIASNYKSQKHSILHLPKLYTFN